MLPTSLFLKCYVVLWPSLKKPLLHPIELRNQSRTPSFMVGSALSISLAQVGFNRTCQQPKHWTPLNYASAQGVIERWALVAWVGALPAIQGSYTSSLITKHGDVVIWRPCDQLTQSSCGCSSYESKVACQCTATSVLSTFTISFQILQYLALLFRSWCL